MEKTMLIVFKLMSLVVFLMSALSLVFINVYHIFTAAQAIILSAGFIVSLVYGIIGAVRAK
jgi:hypothetical protein